MHVIAKKALQQFWVRHPDSRVALMRWYRIVHRSPFSDLDALCQVFPSADYVDGLVVFNIGGNKYRLITAIHFNRGKVYVRDVLTHAAYDRGRWKR